MAPTPRPTPGPNLRERALLYRYEGQQQGGGRREPGGGRGGSRGRGGGSGHNNHNTNHNTNHNNNNHNRPAARATGPPKTVQRGGVGKPKAARPSITHAAASAAAAVSANPAGAGQASQPKKGNKNKKGASKGRRRRPPAKNKAPNPQAPPRAPHSTTQRLIGAADEPRSGVIFPEEGGMRLYEWGSFRGQGRLVKERLGLEDPESSLHRDHLAHSLAAVDERFLGGAMAGPEDRGRAEAVPVDQPAHAREEIGNADDQEVGEQELIIMDAQALRGVVRSLIRTNQRLKRKIEDMTLEAQQFKDG